MLIKSMQVKIVKVSHIKYDKKTGRFYTSVTTFFLRKSCLL